jgi:predicted GNAT superfamily acetyltransferase
MAACVELQRTTWGADFAETVPAAILWVAQRTGGIASGAFAPDGRLLGFVFGISGVEDGRLIHWSDMLAVHPDARGLGLAVALKLHQRELLLTRGIETVYWTFDPLEARNAHINFGRLGVIARTYLRDVYGETGSDLHAGIGTDRLLAEWHIASARVRERLAGRREAPAGEVARISVPLEIQALKKEAPDAARENRALTRAAFEDYLGRGWTVVDVERDAGGLTYLLVPPGTSPVT